MHGDALDVTKILYNSEQATHRVAQYIRLSRTWAPPRRYKTEVKIEQQLKS